MGDSLNVVIAGLRNNYRAFTASLVTEHDVNINDCADKLHTIFVFNQLTAPSHGEAHIYADACNTSVNLQHAFSTGYCAREGEAASRHTSATHLATQLETRLSFISFIHCANRADTAMQNSEQFQQL